MCIFFYFLAILLLQTGRWTKKQSKKPPNLIFIYFAGCLQLISSPHIHSVVGSLHAHAAKWREIGENEFVLKWVGMRAELNVKFPELLESLLPQRNGEMTREQEEWTDKELTAAAGLMGRFTGHLLHIGGATAALHGGMSIAMIRSIGNWESKAALLYLWSIASARAGHLHLWASDL